MPEISDVTLKSTAGSIQQGVDEAFDKAPDNESKIQVLQSFFLSLNRFSRDWKSHIPNAASMDNQGCPDGWEPCPDGSCVPLGVGCGGGLNFVGDNLILTSKNENGEEKETPLTIDDAKKFLSGYLENAASTYFEASPNSEVKQITRNLLDVARLDFSNSVNKLAL